MPDSDVAPSFADIYAEELAKLGHAALQGTRDKPYEKVDASKTKLAALCLSGGGIRSASFALGVLQGLARFDLLGHFDYLSTVSGGGYIGSFLTAWRHHANDDASVFRGLNRPVHANGAEAPEIRGIRAYSNYLTPKLGVLSADTWTAIAIIIRNLLLNWLVFLPFFMGILLAPPLCQDVVAALWSIDGHFGGWLLGAALFFATLGFTVASYGRRRSEGIWLTNGRFLFGMVLPLVIASMCLTGYAGMRDWQTAPHGWPQAVGAGIFSYYASSLLASAVLSVETMFRKRADMTRGKFWHGVRKWLESEDPKEAVLDLWIWSIAGALVGRLVEWGMAYGPALLSPSTGCDVRGMASFLVVTGISWLMLCVLTGELLFVGLRSYSPRGDKDREWLARSAGWFAAIALGWSVFAAISLYGPLTTPRAAGQLWKWAVGTAGLSGAVSLILANSEKTAAVVSQLSGKGLRLNVIASIAGVIFAIALGVLVSWLDDVVRDALIVRTAPYLSRWQIDGAGLVLLIVVSLAFSYWINVNRFSLHALYRNRLVRAFLGSARNGLYQGKGRVPAATIRGADPFTDFAEKDNLRMKDMPTNKLLHVVNLTLDIVSTKNLAWQQRKAESFTITPLACGNPHVRYCPTAKYGSKDGGITLGSAMAISGAAVSPNMGSHSSPLLGFLMTLFNLRLGWWLGNPAYPACACREGPSVGLWPLLQELAGQTTDQRSWIYLSDGGHFDNLGLYEMVRRRCRVIVVSDAGCDRDCALSDLGDCLRKIYIDLGVSIDFGTLDIRKREAPPVAGNYAAVAEISYPDSSDKGWLLYIKPGYHGSERADVRSYASAHPDFPHESTGEQWFNESQLESYRALGAHITELLCHNGQALAPADRPRPLDIDGFKASVAASIRRHEATHRRKMAHAGRDRQYAACGEASRGAPAFRGFGRLL